MASTSDVGTVVAFGLIGVLLGFALRSLLVMLALGIVDVNASWGESLAATFILTLAFASGKAER
jgi:hypothetical protein